MQKLVILVIAIAMSIRTPIIVVEEKKPIFETDSSVRKKGSISVYGQSIRENIKGEWADCDCYDICSCTRLYHVLEDTTEDNFYSAFFKEKYLDYPLRVYLDCSRSMERNFCEEKAKIIKNLSPFLNEQQKYIEDIFKNEETNLYEFLGSFDNEVIGKLNIIRPEEIPIIITDLWNTEGDNAKSFLYDGKIIFCVPYTSTNKEGVLHCEEVVNDLLWNHSWKIGSISIDIVYTDDVIIEYSNNLRNGEKGYINIYVP